MQFFKATPTLIKCCWNQWNYVVLNKNVQHSYVNIINSCQLKDERKG